MAGQKEAFGDFTALYQRMVSDRPFVASLLTGHLAIEFLMRRLIAQYDARLSVHADSLRHHALIDLNQQIGTIDAAQRDVLLAINRLRNKLAHRITYDPTLDELRQLWRSAGAAFSDLTDGIFQGIEALAAVTDVGQLEHWIFAELFIQISYDLHAEYIERGGDDEGF